MVDALVVIVFLSQVYDSSRVAGRSVGVGRVERASGVFDRRRSCVRSCWLCCLRFFCLSVLLVESCG